MMELEGYELWKSDGTNAGTSWSRISILGLKTPIQGDSSQFKTTLYFEVAGIESAYSQIFGKPMEQAAGTVQIKHGL